MNSYQGALYSIIQDSLTLHEDPFSEKDTSKISMIEDTLSVSQSEQQFSGKDSILVGADQKTEKDTLILERTKQESQSVVVSLKKREDKILESKKDTIIKEPVFIRYNFSDTANRQFSYAPADSFLIVKGDKLIGSDQFQLKNYNFHHLQLNWTLIVGLVSITLLLSLKRNYQKFISQVVSTMVNYQLAGKMLREKNIIVRRAFFFLNLNFVLILSLFLLSLTIYWEFRITEKYFYDYLIILGIVIAIIIVRLIALYITGILFGTLQAVNEHIHVSFLVNKNLGLIMLPVVFIILYSSTKIAEFAIYLCLGMLVIAIIYKIFRGFQIIIRNGVLIFYAFLYLCTLELLPLVIGSKLIISLR
jgi:hypothetical protein